MALNDRQKKFANEYLIDFNATQAAIRAGYSKKTAHSIGAENLKKPEIQEYIQKQQKKSQEHLEITRERIVEELAKIGFSSITDYAEIKNGIAIIRDTEDMPQDKIGAIAGLEQGQVGIKLKLNDKIKALELITKMLGFDQAQSDNNANRPYEGMTKEELKKALEHTRNGDFKGTGKD